jgi:hypothetical protein
MVRYFCAEASRQAEEDMIGSAIGSQSYLLIECPQPWKSEAFESSAIPQSLRDAIAKVKHSHPQIRCLLISNHERRHMSQAKVIIYDRPQAQFLNNYTRYEVNVASLEEVSHVISEFLNQTLPATAKEQSQIKDVFVCTHGSHDQCCARYGIPFYRRAIAMLADFGLSNVRIWQTSHFGGHRFAPTAITFPDGRYYGGLTVEFLYNLLTQTGDFKEIVHCYRGWSGLPPELQVLERDLMLQQGWKYFHSPKAYQILYQSPDKSWTHATFAIQNSDGLIHHYEAGIVSDHSKTVCLKGSCTTAKNTTFFKQVVTDCHLYSVSETYYPKEVESFSTNMVMESAKITPATKTLTSVALK